MSLRQHLLANTIAKELHQLRSQLRTLISKFYTRQSQSLAGLLWLLDPMPSGRLPKIVLLGVALAPLTEHVYPHV